MGLANITNNILTDSGVLVTNLTPTTRTLTINGTTYDLSADRSWTIATGVGGSGTTNYLPKFTGTSTIGNSIVFDNGTSVGIGNTSPAYRLDVQAAAGVAIRVRNTFNTDDAYFLAQSTLGSGLFGINATGQYLYTGDAIPTLFYNSGTERMRITSGGQVGIGTTTPAVELAVYSSSTSRIHVQNSTTGVTNTDGFQMAISGADAYLWNFENATMRFATNNTERMRLDASGNLGLGVTPSAWVDYTGFQIGTQGSIGATSTVINFGQNVYYGASGNSYIANGNAAMYQINDGVHGWRIAGTGTTGNAISFTQAMTLNASGNLSLGNTNDTYKLDVSGTARFTNSVTFAGGVYNFVGSNRFFAAASGSINYLYTGATSLTILNQGDTATLFTLANSGAATFSSSVEATKLILQNGNDISWGGAYGAGIPTISGFNSALYFYPAGSTSGERMRLTSTGLGIGTTSPSYLLDVNGTGRFTASAYVNDNQIFGLRTSTNEYSIQFRDLDFRLIGSNDSGSQRLFSFGYYNSNNIAGTWNSKATINSYTGAATFSSSVTANYISSIISSSSNASPLILQNTAGWGSTQITSISVKDASDVVGAIGWKYDGVANVDMLFHSLYNGAYKTVSNVVMTVKGTGNVGIGSTNPQSKFEVVDGTGSVFRAVTNGTNIMEIGNYKTTGSGGAGYQQLDITSSIITFNTGTAGGGSATERMRITSGGDIRITSGGTTNAATLELTSDATPSNGSIIGVSYLGSGSYGPLRFATGGSERMRITSGGSVLIGTTTEGFLGKLQVAGSVAITGQYNTVLPSSSFSYFDGSGQVVSSSSNASALYLDTTWNTTGNPDGIYLNVTNTASGASSKLLNLKVGSVSQFSVSKAGAIQTSDPTNGTARPWKLGDARSGTISTNYYIIVEVNGQTYSIPALQGLP